MRSEIKFRRIVAQEVNDAIPVRAFAWPRMRIRLRQVARLYFLALNNDIALVLYP